MFVFEVDYMMTHNTLSEALPEVMGYYNITMEDAQAIVEAAATRYVSQLCNLAMLKMARFDDEGGVAQIRKVLPFVKFLPSNASIILDGQHFTEELKGRLMQTFMNDVDTEIEQLILFARDLTPEQKNRLEELENEKNVMKVLDGITYLDRSFSIPYHEYEGKDDSAPPADGRYEFN